MIPVNIRIPAIQATVVPSRESPSWGRAAIAPGLIALDMTDALKDGAICWRMNSED